MRQGQNVESGRARCGGARTPRKGPDAAWPLRRCNCGSLTGDSGGPGRRARLMYGPAQVRVCDGRSKKDSFAEGLTAIILRLGVSAMSRGLSLGHGLL